MMVVDDTDRLQPVELTASKTTTTATRSVIYHESTPTATEDETDEVWELVFEATKAHNARIQIVCRSARQTRDGQHTTASRRAHRRVSVQREGSCCVFCGLCSVAISVTMRGVQTRLQEEESHYAYNSADTVQLSMSTSNVATHLVQRAKSACE